LRQVVAGDAVILDEIGAGIGGGEGDIDGGHWPSPRWEAARVGLLSPGGELTDAWKAQLRLPACPAFPEVI
jgi:hypothetical protein